MNVSSKSAELLSLTASVLSISFFIATWLIGGMTECFTIIALSWQIFAGVIVWLVLVILFHQRNLAEREKLDMAQLARSKSVDTIFQGNADRTALFAVAQKRLATLEKWFIPIFSVIIAIYQIAMGLFLLKELTGRINLEFKSSPLAAIFMVIIAFISFLFSRYATGMSSQTQWRPLRAGGSCLLATAIFAFLVSIGMAFVQWKIFIILTILSWVIPVLMIVLGAEIALNLVLDIYRPRISGQYSRIAFDSRLLGLINEPGGILRTFAGAIDYQFGFQVSQTWFYKLLEKAIIPLFLFSIVTLYLFSCIIIIRPGQEAVIEHLGSFKTIAGPGLHVKLPWPFDVANVYPVHQIQKVNVGFIEETDDSNSDENRPKPLLWGEDHYPLH